MEKIKVIKLLFNKVIQDIDAGNSNITETEADEIIEVIKSISDKTEYLSKEQAAGYLHMSTQNFDVLRRKGDIPEGVKRPGITNLLWNKKTLDKYIEEHKVKKINKYCTKH